MLSCKIDVYGISLGQDITAPKSVDGRDVVLSVQIDPRSISGESKKFDITFQLSDSGFQNSPDWPAGIKFIEGVYYKIALFKKDNEIFVGDFYASENKLKLEILPSLSHAIIVDGKQSQEGDGSIIFDKNNPISINGPVLIDGGLYHFAVTITGIEGHRLAQNKYVVFDAYLPIAQSYPFTIKYNDLVYNASFISYFDQINKFEFDPASKFMIAEMPFNWNINFSGSVDLVHGEFVLPKSLGVLNSKSIIATVNGIRVPVFIDRSDKNNVVIHYEIPNQKIREDAEIFSNSVHKNKLIFGLQFLDEGQMLRFSALSNTGKNKVELSTAFSGIEINKSTDLFLNIGSTDGPLINKTYVLRILDKAGNVLYLSKNHTDSAGNSDHQIQLDTKGIAKVLVENINNDPQDYAEFFINVVPEFDPQPLLFLSFISAITVTLVVARKSKSSLL